MVSRRDGNGTVSVAGGRVGLRHNARACASTRQAREPDLKLGRFAGFIKEHTARPAIRWLDEHAPEFLRRITVVEGDIVRRRFWQPGGGYDRNVTEERTLESMIDYIHHNPVRRGLCQSAIDWEWSSARWYAGIRPVAINMDAIGPLGDL